MGDETDIATMRAELTALGKSVDEIKQILDKGQLTLTKVASIVAMTAIVLGGAWAVFNGHTGDGHPGVVLRSMTEMKGDIKVLDSRVNSISTFVRSRPWEDE